MIDQRLERYVVSSSLVLGDTSSGLSGLLAKDVCDVNPDVTDEDLLLAGLRHCRTSLRQAEELGVVFN
jgi:hypothetical protein